MPPRHSAPGGRTGSSDRAGASESTRRAALRRGLACGLLAPTAAGIGVGSASAQSADGAEGPPAPENVRLEWSISNSRGVAWDWSGDPCGDDADHFRAEVPDADLVDRTEIPIGRPSATVVVNGRSGGITIRAVDEAGRESAPASLGFGGAILDPGYTLGPDSVEGLRPGDTVTVPVSLGAIMGENVSLARTELDLSIPVPCVASIADVAAPSDAATVTDLELRDDGSAATVGVEYPVTEPSRGGDVLALEVEAHSPGTTLVDVDDADLRIYDGPFVRRWRESRADFGERTLSEYGPEELAELGVEARSPADFTEEIGAVETWGTIEIETEGPPSLGEYTPRQLEPDGRYRDVTGDGELTTADVDALQRHLFTDAVQEHPEYFDFSGDGDASHSDVIALFEDATRDSS